MDKKLDPDTKRKLDERKQYLEKSRAAESAKINFSRAKTLVIG
jgi:hypothetical protein